MATESRQRHTGVSAALFERPFAFDFFQAVRLLGVMQLRGTGAPAGDDAVRFRTLLSLETPASSIYNLTPAMSSKAPVMTVTFLGLTGPSSALPVGYTEMLLERRYRFKDQTAHHFLDIFNHRIATLFYQTWRKHHVFIDYEDGGRDDFQRYVLSLVGLGTPGLQRRLKNDGVDDQVFTYYSGHLAGSARTVEGLQAMLREHFNVSVHIRQFCGQWLTLPQSAHCRLGHLNCTLGEEPVLGMQVWDQQTKFRVRVGALTRRRFYAFLPTGRAYRALRRLVKFFVGHSLEFEVQLVLRRAEVPACILGGYGTRLGWTTWLNRSTQAGNDADDVVLPEHALRLAS
ncbi:MAG TPA: type VI secretion system baseplate subunit TssG [Rhodocyclaceae bacterium]|nr:type VI secretion system baseplate subunit TssG [Rhodocyclaceae bacterium]